MESFPSNSQRAKVPDEPKIERVTSAEAVRRKRGLGKQFKDIFVTGDDAHGVMEHVIVDIIVPEIKDMFVEAVQSGVERWVHGDRRRPRRNRTSTSYSDIGHYSYNSVSRGPMTSRTPTSVPSTISRRSRARHEFDELIIPTRQEAEEVIDQMFDILSRYGSVSVSHLYELTGIQSSHTDIKWGWRELRGAKAVRLRQGGFLLDLPEPEPLDQ